MGRDAARRGVTGVGGGGLCGGGGGVAEVRCGGGGDSAELVNWGGGRSGAVRVPGAALAEELSLARGGRGL